MRSVARNDNSIECQARFRTIPINEFIDRVTISPLRILRSEAVQDCGFGVFEIEQAQDGSRGPASSSGSWSALHDRWPPCHPLAPCSGYLHCVPRMYLIAEPIPYLRRCNKRCSVLNCRQMAPTPTVRWGPSL